jgi:hypothetical protein
VDGPLQPLLLTRRSVPVKKSNCSASDLIRGGNDALFKFSFVCFKALSCKFDSMMKEGIS